MSARTWPKIRVRKFTWKDASGRVHDGKTFFIDYRLNGKRHQESFADRKNAEAECVRVRLENEAQRRDGVVALVNLSSKQRIDVNEAIERLGDRGTLCEAVDFFLLHRNPNSGPATTVAEAVADYLKASEEDGLRERSLSDLRHRLGRFASVFGEKTLPDVSRPDVDKWLRGLKQEDGRAYSGRSRQHFHTVASGFCNWSIERGWLKVNPFAPLSKSRRGKKVIADESMPGILTVTQTEAVMRAAEKRAPQMVAVMAVQLFAGLRSAEATAIRWSDVNFDTGLITVRPEVAKRRRARHVAMESNLVEWLRAYRRHDASLVSPPLVNPYRSGFDRVRKLAGVGDCWPANACRHTAATMLLARHEDAAKVALLLGHTGSAMLFDHYRALATKPDAEAYFAIRPAAGVGAIRISKAS